MNGFEDAKKTFKYPKAATVQLWDFVSEQLYKKTDSSANRFSALSIENEKSTVGTLISGAKSVEPRTEAGTGSAEAHRGGALTAPPPRRECWKHYTD